MAVTPATLRALHPEFVDTDTAAITAMIAEAVAEVDSSVTPAAVIDTVVDRLACEKLARGPYGIPLRLIRMDGSTPYGDELLRLVRIHGGAYRLEGL